MKQTLSITVLLIFSAFLSLSHAQGTNNTARDSLLLRLNQSLKAGLELSDTKAQQLLTLQKAQASAMDSVRRISNAGERGEKVKAVNKAYKKQLKDLFSQEQMQRYQALEEAQKAALKSRIKERREKEKKQKEEKDKKKS